MDQSNIEYDSEQLKDVVEAGENYYEESRRAIIVYLDTTIKRFRLAYEHSYLKNENNIEVVRIP